MNLPPRERDRLHELDRLRAERIKRTKQIDARRRRSQLADDDALFLATQQATGCLLLVGSLLIVSVLLLVYTSNALAQADDGYPQAAYMQLVSMYGGTETLATQSGRWEVQLTDDSCVNVMLAASQVWLTAPLDDPQASVYVVAYGGQPRMECALSPAVRILRDPTPCATRDGLCDGAREPSPAWWELP